MAAPATIARVNRALKAVGFDCELIRGDGYHYFSGPAVEYAFSASVMVMYTSHLTVEQWLDHAAEISRESDERQPLADAPTRIRLNTHSY